MVHYSNHSGRSLAEAINITGAASHFEGVDAEYQYLAERFGVRNKDYCIEEQHLICDKGRHYDVLKIKKKDGARLAIFFDISESYDRFVINPQ